jgi:hypothetical protein
VSPEGPARSEPHRGPCLSIAGWTVALDVEDESLRSLLSRAFMAFQTAAPPMARVDVLHPTEVRPPPAVRRLPLVHKEPEGSWRLEGEDYVAHVSQEGRRASVTGMGMFPVETTLKVMLAAELARRGGLLVHGVGVEHLGQSSLWVGPSGAGKSTLASLWSSAGGALLSDELVAVWPAAEGWRAAGTPWNIGRPREASLRAVGTLAWDASSRWEAQPAGEVARILLLNALLPEDSAAGRGFLLAAASRLLASVRTARLVFARDASAAEVLRRELERAAQEA